MRSSSQNVPDIEAVSEAEIARAFEKARRASNGPVRGKA
jgi:hypothetical protein